MGATVSWSEATRDGTRVPSPRSVTFSGCGKLVHTSCVEEAGTTISGHHLWFSNMMMRAFVLLGQIKFKYRIGRSVFILIPASPPGAHDGKVMDRQGSRQKALSG